jgi:hypothetical protein
MTFTIYKTLYKTFTIFTIYKTKKQNKIASFTIVFYEVVEEILKIGKDEKLKEFVALPIHVEATNL